MEPVHCFYKGARGINNSHTSYDKREGDISRSKEIIPFFSVEKKIVSTSDTENHSKILHFRIHL